MAKKEINPDTLLGTPVASMSGGVSVYIASGKTITVAVSDDSLSMVIICGDDMWAFSGQFIPETWQWRKDKLNEILNNERAE